MATESFQEAIDRLAINRSNISRISRIPATASNRKELKELFKTEKMIVDQLPELYVASLPDSNAVLTDAKELLPSVILYMYRIYCKHLANELINMPSAEKPVILQFGYVSVDRFSDKFQTVVTSPDYQKYESKDVFLAKEDTTNFIRNNALKYHLKRLEGLPERKELNRFISDLIKKTSYITVASGNPKSIDIFDPDKSLSIYHSPVFDRLAALSTSDFPEELGTNQRRFVEEKSGLSITISDLSSLNLTISIRSHQLFAIALGIFTEQNYRLKKKTVNDYSVRIPTDQYIELLGYDIQKHIDETPEAAKKRIEHTKREARRTIRRDLDILHHTTVKTRTKKGGLFQYSLCQVTGLDSDYIHIKFGQDIIDYLAELPKTQYALWLSQINGRHPDTYRIGNKMVTHATMSANINYGTANRLKVRTLLAATRLPTLEDLGKRTADGKTGLRKWKSRIRQPFETALNNLIDLENGGLLSWHYAEAGNADKKKSISEVNRINNFEDYADLLIVFELA